ncbi:MAG: L-arabinose isomerase [Phycisphaeraceae bacterium]
MIDLSQLEVWFVTGSQHLYGPEPLKQVDSDAREIAAGLHAAPAIPVRVVHKPVLTTAEQIRNLCQQANAAENCIGLVAWMHTFSPAKMWIPGLELLRKPWMHLHTQFNRDIPWPTIDMDFMNLNQSAHGGREFGFIASRLRHNRKVVVGHYQNENVQHQLGLWTRAAAAWHDSQQLKVARIGDNMRNVAVTEGDKVEAQRIFGYAVNGWGLGDLVEHVRGVADAEVNKLCADYDEQYHLAPPLRKDGDRHDSLQDEARIELGLRSFLREVGANAFTDTFENLHGLRQLPGLAVQRLMADGIGFGAEGDWKTAALVRSMKVMAAGLEGGTSFMEDYTYHFDPANPLVLGAHMLEICPSIADGKPACEIHPLGIGGKDDPVRLVFNSAAGPAINASVIDLGTRFRMVVNAVDAVEPTADLPNLPVARALWSPQPNLADAAAAWIYSGAAHHAGFSLALTTEHMRAFADMAGVECVTIDENTNVENFRDKLRHNEVYYHLARGLQ